jgi:hypothetical protein
MSLKTTPTRALFLAALFLPCLDAAAAGPVPDEAVLVAQAGPTPVETEYWRSAERLGTPDAYRAYLATFPNGFYARLAAAALAKADTAAPQPVPSPTSQPAPPLVQHQVRSTAPSPTPSPGFPDAATLQKIADDADSSAVSFKIGDVFAGPGPLSVGRLGSRKQIVVPTGRWVVLAAEDGYSNHRTPVQMTAVAFGLFEGRAVRSIVTAAFDRRPGPVQFPLWSWDEAQRCDASGAGTRFHWAFTSGVVKQCVRVANFSSLGPRGHWKGNVWDPVRDSLNKLGVTVDGARGLLSEFHLTDNRAGYLHVSRYDFGASEVGGTSPGSWGMGQEAALDLRLEARIQWAQEYAALAAAGLTRSIESDDLKPGAPALNGPLSLVR